GAPAANSARWSFNSARTRTRSRPTSEACAITLSRYSSIASRIVCPRLSPQPPQHEFHAASDLVPRQQVRIQFRPARWRERVVTAPPAGTGRFFLARHPDEPLVL